MDASNFMESVDDAIKACIAAFGNVSMLSDEQIKHLPLAFLEMYRPRQVHVLLARLHGKGVASEYDLCYEHYNKGVIQIDGPPPLN
jgi:hypothetical protein